MSTDYGLYCQKCGVSWQADNISKLDAEQLKFDLPALSLLYDVVKVLVIDVFLQVHWGTSKDMGGVLFFAHKHHNHNVIVMDENSIFEKEMKKNERSGTLF